MYYLSTAFPVVKFNTYLKLTGLCRQLFKNELVMGSSKAYHIFHFFTYCNLGLVHQLHFCLSACLLFKTESSEH